MGGRHRGVAGRPASPLRRPASLPDPLCRWDRDPGIRIRIRVGVAHHGQSGISGSEGREFHQHADHRNLAAGPQDPTWPRSGCEARMQTSHGQSQHAFPSIVMFQLPRASPGIVARARCKWCLSCMRCHKILQASRQASRGIPSLVKPLFPGDCNAGLRHRRHRQLAEVKKHDPDAPRDAVMINANADGSTTRLFLAASLR